MSAEQFSLLKFTVYALYLKKLDQIKWYQFGKKRELNKWLDTKLKSK